jgi:hypothetical protein
MQIKVTIEIDGNSTSEEFTTSESLAHIWTIASLNEILVDTGLMDKGNKLEVIGSDESALLEKSGY